MQAVVLTKDDQQVPSHELANGGPGQPDEWLGQLQSGLLSPESAFAAVQVLPRRQRPRALQALLHALSGDQVLWSWCSSYALTVVSSQPAECPGVDREYPGSGISLCDVSETADGCLLIPIQILILLTAAARRRLDGQSGSGSPLQRDGESIMFLEIVVRAAPSLPNFRDICVEDLLCHPTQTHQESGFACVLGLLMTSSPAADEAVAAFFAEHSPEGRTVSSLLKW